MTFPRWTGHFKILVVRIMVLTFGAYGIGSTISIDRAIPVGS